MLADDGLVLWQDERRVISLHTGSSPLAADFAFASISFEAADAAPGELNKYALQALGTNFDLPTLASLNNGFHVCETPSGVRVVFVVTTIKRAADAKTLLRTNLRKALSALGSEIAGKMVWLPLMGMGPAGLPVNASLNITLELLLEMELGIPGQPAYVRVDLPLDLPRGLQQRLYRDAQAFMLRVPLLRTADRQPDAVSRPVQRSRNPVESPGARHGAPAREQALVALLSELFDDDGLRQWVRLTLGREVHLALPGAPVAFDVLCFRLVLQMQQRGLAREAFFASLIDMRPAQAERIREVAALWRNADYVSRSGSRDSPALPSERPQARPLNVDERTRQLGEQLADAYARKQALEAARASTSEVVQEILRLKRDIRSGGQLRPGDQLGDGRYLLLERIGRGGFANVWKALDQTSGEHVAVKVLHSELASDVVRRERFFRGARIMAELDHPAVVRILEPHGEDDGYHYFVMELITGGDLRQAVLQGRVHLSMLVPFLLSLSEALAKAHARRFIHRDIKPANVLLNESVEPRLTDFDLVAAGDTTGGTQTGALGTFVYAAPEMLERPQDADARADVYGLGMTAAFMLHGADLPRIVLRDAAGFIAKLSCDEPLKQILQRAVAWEPEDRFADAAAFCQALREYVQPPPIIEAMRSAHPSSAADLDESFIEPNTGIRFLLVPGGRFTMGSQGLHSACEPPHVVRVSPFWLAETPVTRRQYEQFLTGTEHLEPKFWRDPRFAHPDQPVVSVSWADAQSYCRWASDVSGSTVVLPTEAQWEFAARSEKGYPYPWGDAEPDSVRAHFGRGLKDQPIPVGCLLSGRGPYGHLDQAGNVWEWCLDRWDASAYARRESLALDPVNVTTGDPIRRMVRGGGYTSAATELHAAYRISGNVGSRAQSIGFRVAVLPRSSGED
jgi:formylglycine-generating enzyme required for sulfatase activity